MKSLRTTLESVASSDDWRLFLSVAKLPDQSVETWPAHELSFTRCDDLVSHGRTVLSAALSRLESASVVRYGTVADPDAITWVPEADELVKSAMERLKRGLSESEKDGKPALRKTNVAVFRARTEHGEPVFLFAKKRPVSVAVNKWYLAGTEFKKLDTQVLTLASDVDAILSAGRLYFLSEAGERIFVSETKTVERAWEKSAELLAKSIVSPESENALFAVVKRQSTARLSVRIDAERTALLENRDMRNSISALFGIDLDGKERFSLPDEKAASRFFKVVSRQAMQDPFTKKPVAVSSAVDWEIGVPK